MIVKLARYGGFCFGVKRAFNIVLRAAKENGRVFTFGPLIHNPQAVSLLEKKAVTVLSSVDEVSCGDVVVIRSHGVSPDVIEELKSRGALIEDATCPRVKRVQRVVEKSAKDGYLVVIVGDKGHAEVKGLLGYARGRGVVVSSVEDVSSLPTDAPLVVVGQTTLTQDFYQKIVDAIRECNRNARVYETLCLSTQERQNEVRALVKEVDAVVVVGGYNSANTRRLYEIAVSSGKPTFHIETADELSEQDFEGVEVVGLAAGASTPRWIIEGVKERLEGIGQAHISLLQLPVFKEIGFFLQEANIFSALAASGLALFSASILGVKDIFLFPLIAFLFVLGMHILVDIHDWRGFEIMDPDKMEFYDRNSFLLYPLFILSFALMVPILLQVGVLQFILTSFVVLLGVVYILWGQKRFPFVGKDIALALGWGFVIAVLPILKARVPVTIAVFVLLFSFIVSFVRSLAFSLVESEADSVLGRKSIPSLFGKKIARGILLVSEIVLLAILIFYALFIKNALFVAQLIPALVLFWAIRRVKKARYSELLVNLSLFGFGLVQLIINL